MLFASIHVACDVNISFDWYFCCWFEHAWIKTLIHASTSTQGTIQVPATKAGPRLGIRYFWQKLLYSSGVFCASMARLRRPMQLLQGLPPLLQQLQPSQMPQTGSWFENSFELKNAISRDVHPDKSSISGSCRLINKIKAQIVLRLLRCVETSTLIAPRVQEFKSPTSCKAQHHQNNRYESN